MELSEEQLAKIIAEVRSEYQIPPYFEDIGLINFAKEGFRYLLSRNPLGDIEEDETFQMLLKTYIHYAYFHRVNEWKDNYASMILEWMLNAEVEEC